MSSALAARAAASGFVASERVRRGVFRVVFPPELADAAAQSLLDGIAAGGRVVVEPGGALPGGGRLPEGCWAFVFSRRDSHQVGRWLTDDYRLPKVDHVGPRALAAVYPRGTVTGPSELESFARRSLERARPKLLDERGLPMAWVPAEPPTESLARGSALEDDVQHVGVGDYVAPPPLVDAPDTREVDARCDDSVRAGWRAACALADVGDLPLAITRPTDVRDGFVAGRIWLAPQGPVRAALDIGPNADGAEVWATVLHELAHATAREAQHSVRFQRELVRLGATAFGAAAVSAAREAVGGSYAGVDAWMAVCVRAALRGAAPPVLEVRDETDQSQLARVVGRIQKLRRLARSQPGTPEAISACAKANDLLVRWDLGAYQVRLEAGIDDQMCDRWVDLGKREVWRRSLAFLVAEHCGVFALSRRSKGWMHYFGRYADVVTAEWFYEIWTAHIERAAKDHVIAFKEARAAGRAKGNTRSVRIDFCDSAVVGLREKLQASAAGDADPSQADAPVRLAEAEQFAQVEHSRRGSGWSSGTGKAVRLNEAGRKAGAQAPMGRGVGSRGGPRGLIKG